MSYRDYYSVLGVSRGASAEDMQRAYRKLARTYHPDVSKADDAEARFKEIQEAYEVLKDPDKRRLYDKYGPQWKAISEGRQPPPGPGSAEFKFDFGPFGVGTNVNDLGSIFEQVFGAHQAARGPHRGPRGRRDQETRLDLSIPDAYRGGPREIQFTAAGERRRLSVNVPPGVRDAQRIRLGGQGAGRADLYLIVKLTADERFRLEGDDVYTVLKVSPPEAVLGAAAALVTLDGQVKVKIPPGSSSGRHIRLRERGYPRRAGGRGDLYAEIQVVVPAEPSQEERALYEQLASISRFDPRGL